MLWWTSFAVEWFISLPLHMTTPPAFPGISCCQSCSLSSSRAEMCHPAAAEVLKAQMTLQCPVWEHEPQWSLSTVTLQCATEDVLRPAPIPADAKGEDALRTCFHCPLFFQARWRLSRPEAAFQLHKPLVLFGVMILPLSRLCCSVGWLIPQCDWWKLPYWFLSLFKPQLCSMLVRHLKEYPLGSGAGREWSAVSSTGRPLPQVWGQASGKDWKASGRGQMGSLVKLLEGLNYQNSTGSLSNHW